MNKIKNRKRCVRKQKGDTARDNELDVLGDEDVDSFTGSQADLEGAAAQLFASPPRPQPLHFESPFLTTPAKSVAAPPSANSSPRSAEPFLLNSRTNICTALIALITGKG